MSCEDECRRSEAGFDSIHSKNEFRKDSRITYSRDFLLSLAEVNVTKQLPSGIDRSILSELNDNAPDYRKLLGPQSPCTGRISGDSSMESSETWRSCKLRSKDSKSADSGKFYNQTRQSWPNTGNSATLGSLPNSEHDGILGSWSASKLPTAGSNLSTLKLQGTDSFLLSRCKEPYRPPYKATLHTRAQSHDTSSKETPGCAECSSKEKAMEENWRKDTCLVLEENSAVSAITNKKNPPLICPAVSGSVKSACSAGEASEKCRAEGSPEHQLLLQDLVVQHLPSKNQLLKKDSKLAVEAEKFQGKVGGRFSALINLEEAEVLDEENVKPNDSTKEIWLSSPCTKANVKPNDSTKEIWLSSPCTKKYSSMIDDQSNCRSDSRFIQWFTDNGTSGCNISSGTDKERKKVWGASTGESTTTNLLGQEIRKGPLTHDQRAPYSGKTKTGASDLLSSCSAVRYPDGIFDQSKNVREPELNMGSRNQDLYRSSKEVSGFQMADEDDKKSECNLPDVDSFITIDDTYILKQDQPKKASEFSCRGVKSGYPFPGSNKSRGSEIIQQNLSSPDPRLYKSQLNSWNRSDSKVHVNSPTRYYDPWKIRHDEYPFSAISSPSERLPMKPQKFVLSSENFRSPRTLQAEDYCPELDTILSAEPSVYHQLLQTPRCNQELNMRRSLPLNCQTNTISVLNEGKRGLLAEERHVPAISQFLQMQSKLAQMKLEAAEQRAYNTSANYFFR